MHTVDWAPKTSRLVATRHLQTFVMSSPPSVLIIGAGMSGVAAAAELARACPDVRITLIEARDRAGGRMHQTLMEPNLISLEQRAALGNPHAVVQLGANWIHGMYAEKNPLFAIAQQLHLELFKTSSDDEPGDDVILFDRGGGGDGDASESSASLVAVPDEEYRRVLKRYEWMVEHLADTIEAAAAVDEPASERTSLEQAMRYVMRHLLDQDASLGHHFLSVLNDSFSSCFCGVRPPTGKHSPPARSAPSSVSAPAVRARRGAFAGASTVR
jgi:monoamine oxidase